MQSDLLLLKRMLLTIVTFTGIALTSQGQIPLTIDKAMEIAQENSPSLRRSYMNLEQVPSDKLRSSYLVIVTVKILTLKVGRRRLH